MKKLIPVVIIFCLMRVSFGFEKQGQDLSFFQAENEYKEFNVFNYDYSLWNSNSMWFVEMVKESCNINNQYGSCSVTCDKGKAICKSGYVVELRSIFGTEKRYVAPRCYCQG